MLVLAAAKEELGGLDGEVVGIGPVIAAANASAIIAARKPTGVLLIGTAGAYPGGPSIGEAISSRTIGLSSGVAAMGLGYTPRPPATIEGCTTMMAALHIEPHNVLTTMAVTTDPTLCIRLCDGWTVEHLEAFGVASACLIAQIPFIAVLGISNEVGSDAHRQWLAHRDAAQDAARTAILPLLRTTKIS